MAMTELLNDIIGVRVQDETGAKYTVIGWKDLHAIYIVLRDTLGNDTLVNLDRYDQMIQIADGKSWEDYAKVPYTISAW